MDVPTTLEMSGAMAGPASILRVPGENVHSTKQPKTSASFEIAVVCTGNQFRSPIVEGLLKLSASDLPVTVYSLGTRELGPAKALPEAVVLASDFGVDLSSHRARSLENVNLTAADLVIGFERSHVAAAVVEAGAPLERTFTILELAEILDRIEDPDITDPVRKAREMVAKAHEMRTQSSSSEGAVQLPDPVGGPSAVYTETAERLRALTSHLIDHLFGSHFVAFM
jgi:protein-tyrosine phosphatase